jgi:hypothetical protein
LAINARENDMKIATDIRIAAILALTGLLGAPSGCRQAPSTGTHGDPPPASRSSALDAAHADYLEGNFLGVTQRIRDVLTDAHADALARENALELLEKAYGTQNGTLPSDWTLPEGFEGIQYKQIRRSDPDGAGFEFLLSGRVKDPSRFTGLELRRWPDEVLLQRGTRGTWSATPDDDGWWYFSLESGDVASLPAPGVFTVRLAMSDGTTTEGWFVGDRLVASDTPVLSTPAPSEAIRGDHPTVRWEPFRSPEMAPFERRTLSVWLSRRGDDGNYASPWSLWQADPGERSDVKIGLPGQGGPEVALRAGDYHVSLTYGEWRKLGPIQLMRMARRAQGFHLAP